MSDGLRRLVTASTDLPALRAEALREGMRPLRMSGALKVKAGFTTPQEVFAVVSADEPVEPPASE